MLFALLLLPGLLLTSADPDYVRARQKIGLIADDLAAPSSTVSLSSREINAYAVGEIRNVAPEGIRNPKLELGHDTATGSALVDFLKLQHARGQPAGWLLSMLLEGERHVSVTVQLRSGGGQATVDIQRVELSGIAIDGAALDFLIRNFLLPRYPDVKVGVPFNLGHRMEEIKVRPGGVFVRIGG